MCGGEVVLVSMPWNIGQSLEIWHARKRIKISPQWKIVCLGEYKMWVFQSSLESIRMLFCTFAHYKLFYYYVSYFGALFSLFSCAIWICLQLKLNEIIWLVCNSSSLCFFNLGLHNNESFPLHLQVFVFLAAEYETPKNALNQVSQKTDLFVQTYVPFYAYVCALSL